MPYATNNNTRTTEIHIHRAGAILGRHVPMLTIYAGDEMPMDAYDSKEILLRDAETLAEALWDHLPQGTLDRLVAKLLMLHASDLIVGRR